MSTVSPEMSKKIAALHAQHGSVYIEAPIFGRPEAAVAQQLWIPVAGPEVAKERVDPQAVVDMLTQTLFPAPIYKSYGKRIAEKTVIFSQSKIPLKDTGIFRKTAQQVESPTPIANLLYELMGGNEGEN